jgi:hypothetical protein
VPPTVYVAIHSTLMLLRGQRKSVRPLRRKIHDINALIEERYCPSRLYIYVFSHSGW